MVFQTAVGLGENGTGVSVFGSEAEFFESIAQSNTSSSTLQSKLDVTTASKPAGTYRIGFTCDITNSSGGNSSNVEFSVDGVTINAHSNGPDLYEIEGTNGNDWQSLHAVQYKVLASSATIDLDMKFSNGSGNTARISKAIIEIWRVS